MAPSANLGPDFCLAEPVHGSAPDIAGKGLANPLATLRAASMLLSWLGQADQAQRLWRATDQVFASGPKTPDLGGNAGTEEVTQAVLVACNG